MSAHPWRIFLSSLAAVASLGAAETVIPHSKFKVSAPPGRAGGADAQVEFYWTGDDGATWTMVATSAVQRKNGQPPYFVFTAPGDGSYGFYIRVLPAQGPSDPAPTRGTQPSTRYRIDTQEPKILAASASLILGETGAQLSASWDIEEANPAHIVLEGRQGAAAWQTLAQSTETKGTWRGPVAGGVWQLRMVAVDRVGNRSEGQPFAPIAAEPEPVPAPAPATATTAAPPEKPAAPTIAAAPEKPVVPETPAAPETPSAPASAGPSPTTSTASVTSGPQPAALAENALPSLAEATAAAEASITSTAAPGAQTPAPSATNPAPAVPAAPAKPDPLPLIASINPEQFLPELPAAQAPEASILEALLNKNRMLDRDQSATVLQAARAAWARGDLTLARKCYAKLRGGLLAQETTQEEARLELSTGNRIRARTLAEQAAPEARTPMLLLIHALAWFADDSAEALRLAERVNPQSVAYPLAQYLQARCLILAKQTVSAQILLRTLARDEGQVATEAQRVLTLLAP